MWAHRVQICPGLTAPGTTISPRLQVTQTANNSSVARSKQAGTRTLCARTTPVHWWCRGGWRDEPFPLELNRAARQYSTTTLSISKPLVLLPLLMCVPHSLFSLFFNSTAQRLPKGSSPCRAP